MRKLASILAVLAMSFPLMAQTINITGKITDDYGEAIPGVYVLIKGTNNGASSDDKGYYSVSAAKGDTLQFMSMGYKDEIVPVGSRTTIDVVMHEDMTFLEETIVVGYGTVKSKELTSSISVVKTDNLPSSSTASLGSMLSGRAAGLYVQQTSAAPGGSIDFSIRGSSSQPLIVIDGIPMTSLSDQSVSTSKLETGTKLGGIPTDNNFIGINPEDIESIDVLKDASATSIYGSRAANGVILITTKRGKGDKVNVQFSASASLQKLYGLPEMLSGKDYMIERNRMAKEVYMNSNGYYPYGDRPWNDFLEAEVVYPYSQEEIAAWNGGGTNWIDEVSRLGSMHNESVRVVGGSGKTKYLFSASNLTNHAVLKNNDFDRLTTRLNVDQEFSKYVKGSVSLSYSRNRMNNIFGEGGRSAGAQFSGMVSTALEFNPLLPVRDENGKYSVNELNTNRPNPVSFLDATDQSDKSTLFGSAALEINPFKNFSIKMTVGADIRDNARKTYLPSTVVIANQLNQYAYIAQNKSENYLANIIANYRLDKDDYSLSVMGGFEFENHNENGTTMANAGFPSDSFLWNNIGSGSMDRPEITSYYLKTQRASYLSRVNFSYLGRYILTANLRVDGSSQFAKNKQWGVFPGISAAWRMSDEPWLRSLGIFDNLKLRTGFGMVGNDGSLTGTSTYFSTVYYAFNKIPTAGLGIAKVANPNLSWETKKNLDFGIDWAVLNNRVSGSIEMYYSVITDMIGTKMLTINQEVSTMDYNLDEVDGTRGVDFTLNLTNIDKKDFKWNTNIIFSFYRNFYLKRDPSQSLAIYETPKMDKNGIWQYEIEGLVPAGNKYAGAIIVKDVNGILRDSAGNPILSESGQYQYSGAPDGMIDEADIQYFGNSTPMPISINNTFKYKNFDLSVYFCGMLNNYQQNATYRMFSTSLSNVYLNADNTMSKIASERWAYDNMDSTVPGYFATQFYSGNYIQRYYYEKAWFLRCDNITLGYTLPDKLVKKVGIGSARVYATGRNLFVLTPYTGSDPETDSRAAYPNSRTFTFGVDINF